LVEVFKLFDYPFGLTGGGPGISTEAPSIFVFKTALRNFDFGYGSSLAYLYFIVVMIICSLLLKRVRNVFFQ
jgi:multiple sugar transport system permease protein